MSLFPQEKIEELREKLVTHPIYTSVEDINQLSIFMQQHVYSVWDFMSLVKSLQNEIAPSNTPWLDSGDPQVKRFINEIILEEESDIGISSEEGMTTYTSHFNLYTMAMEEVQAGSSYEIKRFVNNVSSGSLGYALNFTEIPYPAQEFMKTTFSFIQSGKPHVVAAAFAFGREHIIPDMFTAILDNMQIPKEETVVFRHYLHRHIELDGSSHGPMALRMLELLCDDDPKKIAEAQEAALVAINARIKFWDGVMLSMQEGITYSSSSLWNKHSKPQKSLLKSSFDMLKTLFAKKEILPSSTS